MPSDATGKRFCLMTFGRTGSTSLMRALAQADDVAVPSKNLESQDEELTHPEHLRHYTDGYARLTGSPVRNVDELIERFYLYNGQSAFAGFKSMPYRHRNFASFVRRSDIRFLTLTRGDLASTVASFIVAERTGSWRRAGESQNSEWAFKHDDRSRVSQLVSYVQRSRQLLSAIPDAIRLTYEQLCGQSFQNAALDEFFGRPVRLADVRPPTSGARYVVNWDEFRQFVADVAGKKRPAQSSSVRVAGVGIASPAVVSAPASTIEVGALVPTNWIASATIVPAATSTATRVKRGIEQLTPEERVRQEITLIGATPEEVRALDAESRIECERHAADFATLERYCTFIGHPRSGHSLVGRLLDAHPKILIAHELDALRFLDAGFSEDQIYYLLLKNSKEFADLGQRWGEYRYEVRGQYQGEFTELRVIGDKQAGRTTSRIGNKPELLMKLAETIHLDRKFIHVVRNPFDNIATIAIKDAQSLPWARDFYFRLCGVTEHITTAVGMSNVSVLHHEDFLADPQARLRDLCAFLGVEADNRYLEACAGIVNLSPHRSRERIAWTVEQIKTIERAMERFAFLHGYSFNEST